MEIQGLLKLSMDGATQPKLIFTHCTITAVSQDVSQFTNLRTIFAT